MSVVASRFHRPETFIPGCVLGLCGILEWLSWFILFILAIVNNPQIYQASEAGLLGAILIINIIFNAVNHHFLIKNLYQDQNYN